jgi:hypothetical protein
MFCPKCSQPQVSDEVRFCSRCGLPLASVVALLASKEVTKGGEDAELHSERARRQAGIRRGARILFFSVVLFPFFFSICMFFRSPVPLVFPASVFLVGLAALIYAALFGDELLAVRGFRSPRELPEGFPKPALAASLFSPATGVNPQRVNTAEINQPVSVTEHTTKLLAKDQE